MKKILTLNLVLFIAAFCGKAAECGHLGITPNAFFQIFKKTSGSKGFYHYLEKNGIRMLVFNNQGVLTSTRGHIPVIEGAKLKVKLEVKAQDIKAASNLNAFLIIVEFQDAFKRPMKQVKIFNLKNDHDWKNYTREIEIPSGVKYLSFIINNQSRHGTFEFKKLRFSMNYANYQNIIDGAGFEHHLGRDIWFPVSGAQDQDGQSLGDKDNPAQEDFIETVAGRKCLVFKKTGTVDSNMVKYSGEEFIVSGWLKTQNVTSGTKPWGGASLTVIGFDQQRKYLTHQTIANVTKTTSWKFYCQKLKFTSKVKYILCRMRLFTGSKGTAWFDEVKVIGGKGTTKPFNTDHATVKIDLPSKTELIRPIWNGIVALYPHWICNIEYPQSRYPKSLCFPGIPKIPFANESLELAKKQGFEYLRFRGIMHELDFYEKNDSAGNPVYNWKKFDKFFDHVTSYGFKLLVTIDTLPKLLTKPGIKIGTYWKNYPTDFKKWQIINEAMFEHLIKRYGKKTIESWRFHVWNEPWQIHRTKDPFFKTYDGVLNAVKKVEKKYGIDIKMGLSSGCYPPFQEDLMAHIAKTGNAREVDVIAFHIYAGGSHKLQRFSDILEEHKDMAKRYGFRDDIEFWCQEYNASYSSSHPKNWQDVGVNDTSFAAAVVIDANRRWLDAGLTGSTFFALRGWPNFKRKFFMLGGCGMVTKNLVPKATYHSFTFLNQLKNCRRLNLRSTNDPINGIAGITDDNKTVRIILYSVENDCTKPPYTTRVKVKLNIPQGNWKTTKYWVINKDHGDISPVWIKLGKPAFDNTEKINKIRAKAHYGTLSTESIKLNSKNKTIELELPMFSSSVTLIELKNKSTN